MTKIGERIGAIRNADAQTVSMFGFGVYAGDEVPPADVPGPLCRLGLFGRTNPKLVMDSGLVIWGCESWWGPESSIKAKIGDRAVEYVQPTRSAPTEEEIAEAKDIISLYGAASIQETRECPSES